jgi:hypothetical protein
MTEEVQKPHYNVVIATPGHSLHRHYVHSLMATIKWMEESRLTWHFVNKYSSFVSEAREKTATNTDTNDWDTKEFGAGQFTYDKVVWIDSDVSWEVQDFARLISHDLDIVSGMVPVDDKGRIASTIFNEMGHPTVLNGMQFLIDGDPVQVDGVGFGFLAVAVGVFERIHRPWFKIRETRIPGAMYPVNLGEDFSWCEAATAVGFTIWLDPLVKVEHIKEFALRL